MKGRKNQVKKGYIVPKNKKNNDNIENIEIHNEQDLIKHFHNIHNYLRDKFGIYGKSALQFFNFFFVLKLIEPMVINKKIIIDCYNCIGNDKDKCDYCLTDMEKRSFSKDLTYSNFVKALENDIENIGKDTNDDEDYKFKNILQKIRNEIRHHTYLENNIFMSFPNHILDRQEKPRDNLIMLNNFIKHINVLDKDVLDEYHVGGRIYEYFLGFITAKNKGKRGGSQMEDLGQFFTSRIVVRFIIAMLDPKLDEIGNIPTVADFYCGSGGFLIEYIKFFKHKYGDKIDWTKNIQNIYGFDTDTDICKSARVDIMCLTETFNLDSEETIKIKSIASTFTNKFVESEDIHDKVNGGTPLRVKYNITNPPYGGKSMDISEEQIGRPIKHIMETGNINIPYKNTGEYIIGGNNKEAMSLLHGMGMLAEEGEYVGVLKDGVIFDGKYTMIIEQLIENYSVSYIISLPQDDYINTTTKTSAVFYKNSGKRTNEIKFGEFKVIVDKVSNKAIGANIVNPETNKIIYEFISENYQFNKKDGEYMTIPYDKLVEKNYSLSFKKYIKDDLVVKKGFIKVRLGDICLINNKKYNINEENEDEDNIKTESYVNKFNTNYYVEIGDITNNKILNMTLMDKNEIPKGSKRHPKLNEILICSVRPNSKKIVYMTDTY